MESQKSTQIELRRLEELNLADVNLFIAYQYRSCLV